MTLRTVARLVDKHASKKDEAKTPGAKLDALHAKGCAYTCPMESHLHVCEEAAGKCAECGSRHGLEFDFINPVNRGGKCTPDNIQLVCGRCCSEKSGVV